MAKQTRTLVQGHGINDLDEPVCKNGKNLKFYDVWTSMLSRCYSKKHQAKFPTYRGCSVCREWLSLSTFKVWFDANYRDNMALDKDILIPGNKVYCPEACRFVPQYVNTLLTDAAAARGACSLGVRAMEPNAKIGKINTTYQAQCNDGHGKRMTKTFKTVAEAHQWYITTKKKIANEQATRGFEAGDITGDVYRALITREW